MNYNDLARYGRNGDSLLVHMAPSEVAGIASIFPGGVTQNPNTGLPEMFNLIDILGPIAGIAGTAFGGPLVGAGLAGLTTAATSGDLSKGIMAGIGSYALGSFSEALGANAVTGVDTSAAATAMPSVPLPPGAPPIPGGGMPPGMPPGAPPAAPPAVPSMAPPSAPPPVTINNIPYGGANGAIEAYRGMPMGQQMSKLGNAALDPKAWGGAMKYAPMSAIGAGMSLMNTASGMGEQPQQAPRPRNMTSSISNKAPPGPDLTPPVGYVPDPYGRTRFAAGGIASLDGGNIKNPDAIRNLIAEARAALLGEHPRPEEALARFAQTFGEPALIRLQEGMSGGKVSGAGAGLDDLVPGSIEGRQEVRLADGEFVVPSDVVSGLGDGSTDAGSRRLHEMMDRVRRERTGTTEQAQRIDPRVMPA